MPPWSPLVPTSALVAVLVTGCGGGGDVPGQPIRLVDAFSPDELGAAVVSGPAAPAPTEWRFEQPTLPGGAATDPLSYGVEVGPGVEKVRVEDGLLKGVVTDAIPLLHLERRRGLENPDTVHAIEVRLRASAGENVALSFASSPRLPLALHLEVLRREPIETFFSPLVPGEMRTYTLRPDTNLQSKSLRHLLIRPSDSPGATFEIESVRVVFRREHLAEIPSGPSWQGLDGVYAETLVARSPERLRFPVRLGERPWLDLDVGTVEDVPVTFEVRVAAKDGAAGGDAGEAAMLRTVTSAYRWEKAAVDLSRWAGREVVLSLALAAGETGRIGFWGAPVVRDRGRGGEVAAKGAANGTAKGAPQGVILVVADTLRRDHLDVYGYGRETAPAIRRLAEEGVRFADCQAQASWTKPSVYALSTGMPPRSHGAFEVTARLPQAAETIAEQYRQAGYATLGLTSIYYLSSAFNFHQGFETLHEIDSLKRQPTTKSAREYVDRLVPWLEAHADVPFFVLLHVFDPHEPYQPYPPYDTMWADPTKLPQQLADYYKVLDHVEDPIMRLLGWPNRREIEAAGVDPDRHMQYWIDWYDGSIRAMDAEIGRLMTYLESSKLGERTVVLFTSDHGEEFLEHDRVSHGHAVYGEQINVPLIAWAPGRLPAGTVVEETVASIDVMPTLLELSGLPIPAAVQGHSLLATVGLGSAASSRALPATAEKNALEGALGPLPRNLESSAVVDGKWKLIRHLETGGTPRYELFDHRADPLDRKDQALLAADEVARLRLLLESWQESANAARLASDAEATATMDSEQLQRLRSLGYLR